MTFSNTAWYSGYALADQTLAGLVMWIPAGLATRRRCSTSPSDGSRARRPGRLANSPQNLIKWIRDPRTVDPLTVMPAVGLDEAGARDVAAYLYAR